MTANPTPVLPDARALKPCPFCEQTARLHGHATTVKHPRRKPQFWVACGWCEAKGSVCETADAARGSWNTRPTPPASDAAVPAGEVFEVDDRGLFCRHCGRSSVRHHRVIGVGNLCEPAAAPKVASDTGAGLREVAAVDSAAFTSHSIGCAVYQQDRASGEPPCICGLKQVRVAALATDATDGATGGGEDVVKRARASLFKLEVFAEGDDLRRIRDAIRAINYLATTPGADLLEQAARVDEPVMERLATMADHGRIDAAYGNFSHPALTMIADVRKVLPCLRALSARNLTE